MLRESPVDLKGMTMSTEHEDLSIPTRSVLNRDSGNDRLLDEVAIRLSTMQGPDGQLRTQTIACWVREAADQFIGAPVQAFVPVLVEHIVRERITEAHSRSHRWETTARQDRGAA